MAPLSQAQRFEGGWISAHCGDQVSRADTPLSDASETAPVAWSRAVRYWRCPRPSSPKSKG